jgi:RNA polymerase sigma factor (sigma-70 family)
MKITDPGPELLQAATAGDLAALDRLLLAIQPGVFNLALRLLGRREDAADATQEILLKVTTHLGSFRGEAAFTTWVFSIARHHLLGIATRAGAAPEVSLEAMAEKLQRGLDFAATFTATIGDPHGAARSLSPEDKLAARQVALSCTQHMLMALEPQQRLAYVLDIVFGLSSPDAAWVLGTTPAAYRQRLARARAKLEGFAARTCSWANAEAPCRCERQLPALRHQEAAAPGTRRPPLAVHAVELRQAERQFDALVRLGDAAAVFRAHPDYQAPQRQLEAIRAVLHSQGWLGGQRPPH